MNQLEKQLTAVLKHSEALVKRGRDLAQATFDLGQSMTFLGQSEGDALGAGLTQVTRSIANSLKTTVTSLFLL